MPTGHTINRESFDTLTDYCSDPTSRLKWSSVFVLPVWLRSWWREFGDDNGPCLVSVRQGNSIIGIAPLVVKAEEASLLGSTDVCDYLDFIVVPGLEGDFFTALLGGLRDMGIRRLDLRPLRSDTAVLTDLVDIARGRGCEVLCQPEDVSSELDLPDSWEEYLGALKTKQRHEIRRKLRRLAEAGKIDYYFVRDGAGVRESMDIFMRMFTESRGDKAAFLTTRMRSFFNSMTGAMAEANLLKLGVLELDARPVAMIICFDYNNCIYLYNSGYDPHYNSLSVGLLCKILCIKESIREGKQRFDFLKGDETYKHHLGGKEVPLYRCQIAIT